MSNLSRRSFISKSAIAAVGAGVAAKAVTAPAEEKKVSANDKISIALIGCGGQGRTDLADFLRVPGIECLAVCDVDQKALKRSSKMVEDKQGKAPDTYGDFRQVIDRKDIDVVVIGTPDHWHALPTIMACEAGKDVYVEKPLALSIHEGRVMVNAARKNNRVVQMGTQQRSAGHFRDAVDFVKSGQLGKIRLVKCWAYLDWKGELPPEPDEEVPEGVDYDMWLGPAPKRPFNWLRFHFNFRWFWDYSGGLMTDWGAHMIDIANMGMDTTAPKSAMSLGGKLGYPEDAMETPDTQQAILEYDGFNLIWEHALGIGRGPWDREHGIAFHGNNGILVVDRNGWEVFAETNAVKKDREYQMKPVPHRHASEDFHLAHVKNFVDCVRSREKPYSDVEIGHNSMKACHLANIAVRMGRKIVWNNDKEEIAGDAEAQKLTSRTYREPWKLPEI
jgi:predicted dehydrogenase